MSLENLGKCYILGHTDGSEYRKKISSLEAELREAKNNYEAANARQFSYLGQVELLEQQLSEANKVLEMVQDHRKMPHWHDDKETRLYCLTERANEYFEKYQGKKDGTT